jgi:hypothetical protein
MIIAGDFITFSPWEIYGAILLMSIPAQIIAIPILFRTFQNQKIWLWSTVLFWVFVLPVFLFFITEWLAPNIQSAAYRYTLPEQILKFYLPFYGTPPLLASLFWIIKNRPSAQSD